MPRGKQYGKCVNTNRNRSAYKTSANLREVRCAEVGQSATAWARKNLPLTLLGRSPSNILQHRTAPRLLQSRNAGTADAGRHKNTATRRGGPAEPGCRADPRRPTDQRATCRICRAPNKPCSIGLLRGRHTLSIANQLFLTEP